jgi:RES domain-containing protein
LRTLWRLSNYSDLKGIGGEKLDGRWHSRVPGKRIVYLSEHPALALIETLVNLKDTAKLLPNRYQLIKVMVQEDVSTNLLDLAKLAPNWRDDLAVTRALGDAWLADGTALLGVPSVPCPEALNFLFNPLHKDAPGVAVEWSRWIEYDKRLFTSHAKDQR